MMIMRGDVLTDTIFRWTKDEQKNSKEKGCFKIILRFHTFYIYRCVLSCLYV